MSEAQLWPSDEEPSLSCCPTLYFFQTWDICIFSLLKPKKRLERAETNEELKNIRYISSYKIRSNAVRKQKEILFSPKCQGFSRVQAWLHAEAEE